VVRLEQLRAEILERLERLDRRFGQMELRIIRVEQRADDLARLQLDLLSRLDAIRDLLADHIEIHH